MGGTQKTRTPYRAVFVSDVHLGSKSSQAGALADFLKSLTCEKLFVVGDFVDGWKLRKTWYWNADHDRLIRRIVKMAKTGTEVTYIPGNHDEGLRKWISLGISVAGIRLARNAEHRALDGRRIAVFHGDEFDVVIRYAKFLAHLGDIGYGFALWVNRWFNVFRTYFGYGYWSLSAWLKFHVKEAVKAIDGFEQAVARESRSHGYAGAVCGHIHSACIRDIAGFAYMNCGDWVDSCTALVDHIDGRFDIIR